MSCRRRTLISGHLERSREEELVAGGGGLGCGRQRCIHIEIVTPFAASGSNEKAWNVRIVEPRCVERLKERRRRRWFGEGWRGMRRDEMRVVIHIHGFDEQESLLAGNAEVGLFERRMRQPQRACEMSHRRNTRRGTCRCHRI